MGERISVSDEEWEVIGPLFPPERGRGCRPAQDNRRYLEGMIWIARTGAQWRRLPDEYGNWTSVFWNRSTETGTLKQVMKAFDWQLKKKAYILMSGQIVDASLVPAPKQRNTEDEKAAIKAGKSADEIWPNEPNKAAQKDTNARWALKIGLARAEES